MSTHSLTKAALRAEGLPRRRAKTSMSSAWSFFALNLKKSASPGLSMMPLHANGGAISTTVALSTQLLGSFSMMFGNFETRIFTGVGAI